MDYGLCVSVSHGVDIPWEVIKKRLNQPILENIIEPTLGDEKYHVWSSKYMVDDTFYGGKNYYIKVSHSIAEMQHVAIPVLEDVRFTSIPISAREVCHYCGCVLTLDGRGGCRACGGPAGRRKDERH
jgi:hypothetical protein